MKNQKEVWKDVKDYEGIYQVSNLGNVKRVNKKLLNGVESVGGYLRVHLSKNGIAKKRTVHQLVAVAFLGHNPCGMELVVNHINFNKKDNRLTNLEIVTSRENSNLKHIKSSSQYVGVSWHSRDMKWYASITVKKKQYSLGYFNCEVKASDAYQKALKDIQYDK